MQHFFKNRELARLYPISEGAVRKWIQAAKAGNLDLQLVTVDGHDWIANTDANRVKIKEMVEANRKYRDTRYLKSLSPSEEFYKLYSPKQIRHIIASLENDREIPLQYSYFEKGADYWSDYSDKLTASKTPNLLTSTNELLESNLTRIDGLIAGHKRVNVVDLGVGNALPAKGLLAHLLHRGVLGRYVGVDISPDMLDLAERNIKEWFGEQVIFVPYLCDISRESFDDALIEEVQNGEDAPINLILLFGGTINNLHSSDDALRTTYNSMWANDVLVYSTKLDTPNSRQFFDFSADDKPEPLAANHRLMLDMLSISDDLYEVERKFDEIKKVRTLRVILKAAVSIKFDFNGGVHWVHLNKGDGILVWRAWHHDAPGVINQFDRNGFSMLQASLTQDYEYLLTASRIKIETD